MSLVSKCASGRFKQQKKIRKQHLSGREVMTNDKDLRSKLHHLEKIQLMEKWSEM